MNNSIFKSRFVAAILTGIVVLGTPLYIVAEDEDLTNQLDSIQQQVNQQNAKKADAETVIVSVSEQLRQIEEQLRQAQQQLDSIQQQRIAVENDITVNEKLLAEAQKRLEGREAVFYKRVRDIYINGRLSYLDVVIGSKDFTDFANRLETLEVFLSGTARGEAIVAEFCLDGRKQGVRCVGLFIFQPHREIKFPHQCHLHLLFIQKRTVLFEQFADRRILLCLHPVVVKKARRVKALAGVHRQQLHARLRAERVLKRTDLGTDRARRQDADVGRLDDVKHKIAGVGGNAVVCDLLNAHELLGGLPAFIFFLLSHVGSSHSKICCSVM